MTFYLELPPAVAAVAPHAGAVAAHKLLAHGGGGAVPDKHALALVTLNTKMLEIKLKCQFEMMTECMF